MNRVRRYVCPKCNRVVDQPGKRWWSGWRHCASGHVLYVAGLGASQEQSFWKSFVKGLARSVFVFGLIVMTLAVAPGPHPKLLAPGIGCWVAIFYLLVGLSLLGRAPLWAGRAGPVQRLVAHAKGRAYGFLTAVLCQLGLTIPLLFAK